MASSEAGVGGPKYVEVEASSPEISPPEPAASQADYSVSTGQKVVKPAKFVENATGGQSDSFNVLPAVPCLGKIPNIVTVMVAGKLRSGKSTALNNIFGLKLEAKPSPTSVTSVVSVNELTKSISDRDVMLRVIDTPGLGALDIPKDHILKEMKSITRGVDYTLIYCFSISPTNALNEMDKAIILNLQNTLGRKVWDKCVLLFTFSDHAFDEFDSVDEYKEYVESHVKEMNGLFQSTLGKEGPRIKSIFEYRSAQNRIQEDDWNEIVAIPVKKKLNCSSEILPGILEEGEDWTDVAFIELLKKTDEEERESFVILKYMVPLIVRGLLIAAIGFSIGGIAKLIKIIKET